MHNNKEGNILVFYTGKCLGKQLVEVDERFKSINVNLKMYSFDHLRMYNIDHINTFCSRR